MTEYEGRLLKVQGNEVTFKLDRDFDLAEAKRLSIKEQPRSLIRVIDERNMTFAQNGMIHALFEDIALHTGHSPEFVKDILKARFSVVKGIEGFSMGNLGISQVFAGEFIEHILEFCFMNEIPFKYQQYHLAGDITKVLFLYIKYKQCFICGNKETAQYAHYEAVGMGRNRKTIDHSKHRFMCLCDFHHREQHNIGVKEFLKKYVIIPIKLTPEQIAEFRIGKNIRKEKGVEK